MASYDKAFESYKKALTTAASVAATAMLVRSMVNDVVPYELRELVFSGFGYLRSRVSSQHTIIVEKKNDGFTNNYIYNAVRTYLATRLNTDLLYGPPGTGKSSLIAAMANLLRFDIYDLELTGVNSNSDLRRLLVGMSNRSILVVEDIDCSIELKQREECEGRDKSNSTEENKGQEKVTLSGLLNFVDGLWSTSGEERIIVFTTNYKERLDPALLRPGRMDMHIHMGYCTQESFRILANNYHSINYHDTYPEIEKLIKDVKVTPAEVAEVLMRNDDIDVVLHDLVDFLKSKCYSTEVISHRGNALRVISTIYPCQLPHAEIKELIKEVTSAEVAQVLMRNSNTGVPHDLVDLLKVLTRLGGTRTLFVPHRRTPHPRRAPTSAPTPS